MFCSLQTAKLQRPGTKKLWGSPHCAQWPYTGGLEILGSKFCIVFFCLLRPYYLHKGGGKCNEPSGKVNKGPKSMPTLTQNADFTLLFAILHEIPIAPKRPLSR